MLRRVTILLMALLMVFSAFAGAEEETLFRARDEQGLWGYINAKGEWVIEPQFYHATDFYKSDYAMVESGGYGFIDKKGNWAVEPHDFVDDPYFFGDGFTGWLHILEDPVKQPDGGYDRGPMGFFDEASGYFSGMRDDWNIYLRYTESDLIPVSIYDSENDRDLLGYVNRRNGELAIPYMYDPGYDPPLFHDGVAHVYDYVETDEDETGHFIDEQGNAIQLEEGLQIRYGTDASCGRILVQDTETGLYGYVDTKGKLVIPAIYPECGDFGMDRAWVRFSETESGMIDPDGNEIIRSDRIKYINIKDAECGYALIWFTDKDDGGWITADGRIIDKVSTGAKPAKENRFWESAEDRYWHLTDEEGNILSGKYGLDIPNAVYFFDEGLVCVENEDGLWGFLDEDGREVIPCQWDDPAWFYGGLAEVQKDGKMAYIDREGKVVWQGKVSRY